MSEPRIDIGGRDILLTILSVVLGNQILPDQLVTSLSFRRFTSLARLLHYRIATLEDRGLAATCLGLLEKLPEESLSRLLRSPSLCEVLRGGGSGVELRRMLACELALNSGKAVDCGIGWSSLGDAWLGDEAPDTDLALDASNGTRNSPSLHCGIPIDLSLPAFVGRPSAGLVNPRALGRDELRDAVTLLDAAIATIQAIWPTGHSALTGLTSTIVLRVDDGRLSESWGASSGSVIGRVVLVNPTVAGEPQFVADHLLHEVTHTALDCIELDFPLMSDPASVAHLVVPSPWTGNPLTIHAFLHACAVWAVLLEYWSRWEGTGQACSLARKRQAFILRGFAAFDPHTCIAPARAALNDSASRLLSTVAACAGY